MSLQAEQAMSNGERTNAGPRAVESVLVVDDEAGVRELVKRWLESSGYEVVTACDAEQAMNLADAVPVAVLFTDIRMPGHDGLWLAEQMRQRHPDTAVIMATGVQEVDVAVASLRRGVVDYLTKPFSRDRVREAVQRGIAWHATAQTSRLELHSLEAETRVRHARLSEAITALRIDSPGAVEAMLSILFIQDRDSYAHAYRVAAHAVQLACAMGLDEGERTKLERAALLHDVGRAAMPETLLRKPAELSPDELQILRTCPARAHDVISRVPYLAEAAEIILAAREWHDGSGYPRHLRGNEIPLASRILSVVDVFDTLISPRPFRDAFRQKEAADELRRSSGTQFDPQIVAAFLETLSGSSV